MTGPVSAFLGAAQFLTRVPIRLRSAPDLARSARWFPAVGACVGVAVGLVAAGAMEVVPPSVAAAVAVIFGVALTGAFHEDGLADTMDALGGWTPEGRREILKDSRHGSYGVAAMCSTIILRILCVATLAPAAAFAGLIAAHTLGRGGAVALMATGQPVAENGLGSGSARSLTRGGALLAVASSLMLAGLATGWWLAPLAAAAALGTGAIAVLAHRAFGGVSGDLLGAAEQVVECAVLVVATGLAMRHELWWQ